MFQIFVNLIAIKSKQCYHYLWLRNSVFRVVLKRYIFLLVFEPVIKC